jgi:hypothetical protein
VNAAHERASEDRLLKAIDVGTPEIGKVILAVVQYPSEEIRRK